MRKQEKTVDDGTRVSHSLITSSIVFKAPFKLTSPHFRLGHSLVRCSPINVHRFDISAARLVFSVCQCCLGMQYLQTSLRQTVSGTPAAFRYALFLINEGPGSRPGLNVTSPYFNHNTNRLSRFGLFSPCDLNCYCTVSPYSVKGILTLRFGVLRYIAHMDILNDFRFHFPGRAYFLARLLC